MHADDNALLQCHLGAARQRYYLPLVYAQHLTLDLIPKPVYKNHVITKDKSTFQRRLAWYFNPSSPRLASKNAPC
jgi:hypothetical protein